jgi:preprotein translocase subunit SecG
MYILVLIVHIIVCLFLVIVVLLQSGKAADLAGAFGGMGSQTAFGPRGSATLLSKATTISAALFMVTSLSLSILATRNAGLATTVLEGEPTKPVPTGTVPQPAPTQAPSKTIQVPLPQQNPSNTGPGKIAPVPIPNGQQKTPAPPAPAKK